MEPRLFEYLTKRLDSLEHKVDSLLQFKWQVVGGGIAASVLLTATFQVAQFLITHKQ